MSTPDLQRKLERFEASLENGSADGSLLEELVEQCAADVPDWELSDCWPLRDYPRLSDFGLEPYDDGIDLIAEKTEGRRADPELHPLPRSGDVPGPVPAVPDRDAEDLQRG